MPCIILLRQGAAIGGIVQTTFNKFATGETRNSDIVLLQALGGVSSIEVIPQVDVTNPASIMPLPQTTPKEIGT